MSETKRVFFAVGIPPEIREKIARDLLQGLPQGVKPVKKENLHFTLVFVGGWPSERTPELVEAGKKVSGKAFGAEISGIGQFHSRVLWIGIAKGAEEMEVIAGQIGKALGLPEQKFSAHLTIARNKSLGQKEFAGIAESLGVKKFSEKFRVQGFELMESELLPDGPEYKALHSFSFA
ncbi:MAG: RNA 2',3'-cyclic phosphodiesterase [Candidatus Diapherotrites archaeon]|nr:RNA 2',3'-cyclic phosphodiesterase [Candidatus Diapherotrites archaeon]